VLFGGPPGELLDFDTGVPPRATEPPYLASTS
jgi:hypothetical protein